MIMRPSTLLIIELLLPLRFNLSARPVITSEPTSLAVLLGRNATSRVSATGTAPLTYQGRSDAGDLTGATNASLVMSNVTLADSAVTQSS